MFALFIHAVIANVKKLKRQFKRHRYQPSYFRKLGLTVYCGTYHESKNVEGLPLYRQEKQFHRMGLALSRQTMANWIILGADQWFTPLYDRMHQLLLKLDILCADETTLQVLHEPGRSATSKSYLWLYRTGMEGPPIVLYDYQETELEKIRRSTKQDLRDIYRSMDMQDIIKWRMSPS